MLENIDKRKVIISGLLALLAVVVLLIVWWLFGQKAATPAAVAPPTQPAVTDQQSPQPAVLPPVTTERLQEDKSYPLGLKQLAMAFAERFGSYSTDEPTKNMDDLAPFMTERMKKGDSLRTDLASAGIFSGFSTKALSSNLVSVDAGGASVVVKTQRTQTLGSGASTKTYFANLELSAVKSGSGWLIDSAKWQ